jgi:hypothetical protein
MGDVEVVFRVSYLDKMSAPKTGLYDTERALRSGLTMRTRAGWQVRRVDLFGAVPIDVTASYVLPELPT